MGAVDGTITALVTLGITPHDQFDIVPQSVLVVPNHVPVTHGMPVPLSVNDGVQPVPLPVIVIVDVSAVVVDGVNRKYTGVFASVVPLYETVAELLKLVLFVDTVKSAFDELIVIGPPEVRPAPDTVSICAVADVVNWVTLPKLLLPCANTPTPEAVPETATEGGLLTVPPVKVTLPDIAPPGMDGLTRT